ncbi:MAG: hypothetical protein ACR2PF_03065 [Rhizobiaceae bacterium]
MSVWQWFWTLVGFLIYIIVLISLYFYKPFEDLFVTVVYGLSYHNAIFWAGVIIGIVGLCVFHWRAYRLHMVKEHNLEAVVLASLQGSTFIAILLSASAALQVVQIMAAHLIQPEYALDAVFGRQLLALITLVVVTGLFCVVFWLLRSVRQRRQLATSKPSADRI